MSTGPGLGSLNHQDQVIKFIHEVPWVYVSFQTLSTGIGLQSKESYLKV